MSAEMRYVAVCTGGMDMRIGNRAALRRERREKRSAALRELTGIRSNLACAYSAFNATADPELLEASILEICALKSRYSSALRSLKHLEQES